MPGGCVIGEVNFKGKVQDASFSPDGRYVAVAVDRDVMVWQAPPRHVAFMPLRLLRSFAASVHADLTCIAWSTDSTLSPYGLSFSFSLTSLCTFFLSALY